MLTYKKCVEQENYIVDIARNETEGLDMTSNNRDKYSLIILDTETPDLNVSRFLQKIRKKVKLPVLMLTGTREKEPGMELSRLPEQMTIWQSLLKLMN